MKSTGHPKADERATSVADWWDEGTVKAPGLAVTVRVLTSWLVLMLRCFQFNSTNPNLCTVAAASRRHIVRVAAQLAKSWSWARQTLDNICKL